MVENKNFIIVFVDDMGYGDIASYGHPTIKTPNLDIMAKVEGEKKIDEWTEYHQTKGETKILNHYSLRILKDYGSFN